MNGFVYLDHNATTPVRPAAARAVADALALCGNASSVHRGGRTARQLIAGAREAIARAIGLPPGGEIVFTSGGTEANRLALVGTARPVLRSAIEHDSVRAADPGAAVLAIGRDGRVDPTALAACLAGWDGPVLVSVMAANNETGILQPIAEIVRVAHRAGALVHCDAVQAIGKIPFDMAALGCDLVTLSAHKFGGPQGIGALAIGPGVTLAPVQTGGGQERGLRSGTENLPGIAGMGAAIGPAVAERDAFAALAPLRDRMERDLIELAPDAVVFGGARLANTSCIALPGLPAETQVMALDLAGIGVSAGAACSSGKLRPSHVIEAMGHSAALARSAIRISLGPGTTAAEIDHLVRAWGDLVRRTAASRRAA